jgi:hypothetical protein
VALLLVNLTLLLGLASVLEIVLRITITYNPGYYVSFNDRTEAGEIEFEWGIQKFNSLGFADEEFDLSKPVRIGYAGDSVTRGVGCGYGYRYTELLENAYPDFLHANLGKSGAGIAAEKEVDKVLEITDKLKFTTVVCALNLNDCLPETYAGKDEATTPLRRLKLFFRDYIDWLRPRSYLYNFVRTRAKNYLQAQNIDFHGYPSAELFPTQYEATIRETAARVNRLHAELDQRGVDFIVLIFPYEMQISEAAARAYAAKGIHWEPEFVSGSTQKMLMRDFTPGTRCYDLLDAFVDPEAREASRARYDVGECFVYNRGDRLDWNHPNRKGHRLVAEYLIREGIFDHLGAPRGASGSPDSPASAAQVASPGN